MGLPTDPEDLPKLFELAQIECQTGGWGPDIVPAPETIKAAEQRWIKRCYKTRHLKTYDLGGKLVEACNYQCGGCLHFAATGSDFGICMNPESPLDGTVTFEHGGCEEQSQLALKRAAGEDPDADQT